MYCTALIDGNENPSGRQDQDTYLRALNAAFVVDTIELGHYVARLKTAPLAVKGPTGKPELARPAWPIMVQDASGVPVPNAKFMVSIRQREEKGSDVNVASHLLVDVLSHAVDGAIVLSNDSDLRYPIQHARLHVPIGTVNPTSAHAAGDLRGRSHDGAGRHWWYQLTAADLRAHQLPDPCSGVTRPTGW